MHVLIGDQKVNLTKGANGRLQATFTATDDTNSVLIPSDCIGTLSVNDIQLEQGSQATSFVEPAVHAEDISGIFKDLRDIRNELALLKTGSNANGYWVRFPNGLQICYNPSYSIDDAITSNSIGAIYRSPHKQIDFPIEFASAPSVSYEPVNEWQTWVTSNGATNTYDKVVIYSGKRDIMCSSVSFIAIGRWK